MQNIGRMLRDQKREKRLLGIQFATQAAALLSIASIFYWHHDHMRVERQVSSQNSVANCPYEPK
jgi:hypothetical protein